MRHRIAALLLTALPCAPLAAQEGSYGLPDIGSSAGSVVSPAEEGWYGQMLLREYRRAGLVLDDPLLDAYLQGLGYRLVASSERPTQSLTFLWLRDREVNAFATLGGYVAVNAGLFLHAESEDEVAAVLAHEVAHVTQRHIVRAVERAQKDTLPIALAMLGAMIAAQQSNSSSSGDAAQAAIASGMALMQQRQINYTRSNEQEADRVGIHALARAGYDADAMARFFERMQRLHRTKGAGSSQLPEYLRTHPVTTSRISEAKDRARNIQVDRNTPAWSGEALNPLLPGGVAPLLAPSQDPEEAPRALFRWARERLRVLSAESPVAALAEYRHLDEDINDDALAYGRALAQTRAGQPGHALATLEALAARHPDLSWIELARAEAEHRAGQGAVAEARYEALLREQPGNPAVTLSYAGMLTERGSAADGRRAQAILRPLLGSDAGDPAFQLVFARAAELAGDLVRAGEAHAEAAYLAGRPEDALNQLQRLKQQHTLDYYQRARIDARIARMTPVVLEARRRGIRPGDADRGPLAPRAAFR